MSNNSHYILIKDAPLYPCEYSVQSAMMSFVSADILGPAFKRTKCKNSEQEPAPSWTAIRLSSANTGLTAYDYYAGSHLFSGILRIENCQAEDYA